MKLPRVTVTALSVGARQSDRRMSVAVLSSVSGRTRTAHCPSMDRVGNRFALLCVVGQSLAALKRPAQVSVVCNDARALTAMKQAAHRSELGGEHAAEYAAYAAAEPHEVEYRFARGEAMGELGKAAYREGLRRLEGLTNRGVASWRIVTGIV